MLSPQLFAPVIFVHLLSIVVRSVHHSIGRAMRILLRMHFVILFWLGFLLKYQEFHLPIVLVSAHKT
jgi:hypothetical protein